jgi:ribosomal protein L7/L12
MNNKNKYSVYHPECSTSAIMVIKELRYTLDCDLRTAKDHIYDMKDEGPKFMFLTDNEVEKLKLGGFEVTRYNRYNITIDDDIF